MNTAATLNARTASPKATANARAKAQSSGITQKIAFAISATLTSFVVVILGAVMAYVVFLG